MKFDPIFRIIMSLYSLIVMVALTIMSVGWSKWALGILLVVYVFSLTYQIFRVVTKPRSDEER